jgi:hypothetical protein
MLRSKRLALAVLIGAALLAGSVRAADKPDVLKGLIRGKLDELKSAGALAFGPDGILFVGDSKTGTIFAIDTGDAKAGKANGKLKVEGLDGKIASLLGIEAKQVAINDLRVNPVSRNIYLSVSRGKGPDAAPVIIRVTPKGEVQAISLEDVKYDKVKLPNPTENEKQRQDAITHIEYVKGKVYVAGLSNEEFSSRFLAIPFPFKNAEKGTKVEIYHGSHGGFETKSPIRIFAPFEIKGETNLLSAYTCTPLVKVPVSDLKPGEKIKGTTIAELGNRNRPLAMFVYKKDGKDYILMANSSRGVMKISTENIDKIDGITKRVKDKAGLKYETVENLKGVQKLDKFGNTHAVLLALNEGALNLTAIELP